MAHEHSFANPGPQGLGALAMACFTFFAILTGKVAHNAYPILVGWLMGGFVCQIVAGLIELKDHNILGGNVFTFFAAMFMLATAIRIGVYYGLHEAGLHFDARVNGWAWLAGAAFLIAMTPGYLKSPAILFFAVVLIDVALICLVGLDLRLEINRALWAKTAGWSLFIAGWIGVYLAGAIVLNTHFGKVILPTGPVLVK